MNIDQHRRDQDRAVILAVTAVCGLGLAGALLPAVERALNAAVLTAAALALGVAVVIGLVRWALRRLRERREDAADALSAAAWRAQHMPHFAAQLDPHQGHHGRSGRDWAGVA